MTTTMPRLLPTLPLLFALLASATQSCGKDSTKKHQRRVAIAHKLEAAPLDQALFPEREWARQWVLENPDVRIRMCMQLLPDLRRPRYKFRAEIVEQMMLSSAAFLIEHPDKAGDHLAENVGGLQGVLKAYAAIVKSNPDARVPALDEMLENESRGKLVEYARETIKACHF